MGGSIDTMNVSIRVGIDRVDDLVKEGVYFQDAIEKVLGDTSRHKIHKDYHEKIRKRLSRICYIGSVQKNSYISGSPKNIPGKINLGLLDKKSTKFHTF